MKKQVFLLVIFSVLFLQCALAANMTLSLNGNSFVAGQTVSAKLAMDKFLVTKLTLLDSSNIKVPVGFFYYDYGNKEYFVYFNLPSSLQGNYKLFASDRIMEDGVLKEVNASAAFSVSSGNAFVITPAIVKISPYSPSFRISMRQTAGSAIDISVSVSDTVLKPVRNSISLLPGQSKTLIVSYDASKLKSDAVLALSTGSLSYEIPVIAPKQAANATELKNQTIEESFEGALVAVKNITVIKNSAPANRPIAGSLEFRNKAKSPLHDITFTSSGISSLEFNETSVPLLEPGAVYSQYIWMNRQKNAAPGKYFGTITAASREGASLAIELEIEFTPVLQQNATELQQNVSVPLEKPGKVTVEKVNVSLGIPIANFTELKQTSAAEKRKNLVIALTISAFVLLIAFLFFYRIRPKTKVREMGEYAEEIGRPRKK